MNLWGFVHGGEKDGKSTGEDKGKKLKKAENKSQSWKD